MKNILDKLNINETYTKPVYKQKVFNHVKNVVPPIKSFNYMADLLHLPEDKQGFRYALVVVDLADDSFDIEKLKAKSPSDVLAAMKIMFKRGKYIKEPEASIKTDSGTEFQSVFHKYLYSNSIMHKVAPPNHHRALSNVENLNKQLGRLFNGYMNTKEQETGKTYKEWTDVIDTVRDELNKFRIKKLPKYEDYYKAITEEKLPDYYKYEKVSPFKVGDVVFHILDAPNDALGDKQNTKAFRVGDVRWNTTEPKKITKIIYMRDEPFIRFMLQNISNRSYTANELMLAPKEKESKYKVKEIIDKKTVKKNVYYLVWWKNYKKDAATWELKKNLIEDGLEDYINAFEIQDIYNKKMKDKKK